MSLSISIGSLVDIVYDIFFVFFKKQFRFRVYTFSLLSLVETVTMMFNLGNGYFRKKNAAWTIFSRSEILEYASSQIIEKKQKWNPNELLFRNYKYILLYYL